MLGNNFLKNNLTSFEMLNLNSNFGLKNLLTNNIKKIAWTKPATDTPYDKKTTNFSPKTFPETNIPIIIIFKIIGAAEAAANLLWEFKIAEKNDAKLTNKIKGKVIFVNWIAKANFSGLDLKPGAIKDTNKGINNSAKSTNANRKIVRRLKILFAKFSDFFFPLISSLE